MTFNPTKKTQQRWIDRYLNGGVCPDTKWEYQKENNTASGNFPCYEAMEWLSKSNVMCLEDIWEECNDIEWLGWMFARMEPSKKDARRWVAAQIPLLVIAHEISPYYILEEEIGYIRDSNRYYSKRLNLGYRIRHVVPTIIAECADQIGSMVSLYQPVECTQFFGRFRELIPNPWTPKRNRK